MTVETSVLPVRIIMFPTCSNRLFAGRNALSAAALTMPTPAAARRSEKAGDVTSALHDLTSTRHQPRITPSGPYRGTTRQVAGSDCPAPRTVTTSPRWDAGSLT